MSRKQLEELEVHFAEIWKNRWLDKRLAYVLACSFVGNEEAFDYDVFQAMKQGLKRKLGTFHLLQGPIMDTLIGLLMANDKTTDNDLENLLVGYDLLVEAGFKRSSGTYYAALMLSLSGLDPVMVATRGQAIFQAIREDHPWITSTDDASGAVMLALQSDFARRPVEEIAAMVEDYYQGLRESSFSKFADLQYAAASCANYFNRYDPQYVAAINSVVVGLKAVDFHIDHLLYTPIVTLAYLSEKHPVAYRQIAENDQMLKTRGHLRFDRSMRQLLAVSLYTMQELREAQKGTAQQLDALTVSLMIMQEQMAVAAATTAVIVSSTAGNN